MALTGILRAGYIQLRVLDMDEAVRHYVDYVGLTLVDRAEDGRVYLKGYDEFDRHSIILRQAESAGFDTMGFKVAREEDLEVFAERISAWGLTVQRHPAGEMPGVGERISCVIPSGHRIELYARMETSEYAPQVHNPEIWTEKPRGMRAIRFDHALLYGPNVDQVLDFFVTALDFRLAEQIVENDKPIAIWLTCATKPHDVAFVFHPEKEKFHHVGFFIEDWNDIGNAADIMARNDISIDIGPTRHGVTRGQTIYFFDPSGNRNEVFTGGYLYYPDNPTRCWDSQEIGKAIFYYERQLNDRFLTVVT